LTYTSSLHDALPIYATDSNTTIQSAYRQIETYKAMIPSLFTFNAFSVISDGLEAKAGTISAELSRFMAWKTTDGISEASKQISRSEEHTSELQSREK